jgi:hypothetical protein
MPNAHNIVLTNFIQHRLKSLCLQIFDKNKWMKPSKPIKSLASAFVVHDSTAWATTRRLICLRDA